MLWDLNLSLLNAAPQTTTPISIDFQRYIRYVLVESGVGFQSRFWRVRLDLFWGAVSGLTIAGRSLSTLLRERAFATLRVTHRSLAVPPERHVFHQVRFFCDTFLWDSFTVFDTAALVSFDLYCC